MQHIEIILSLIAPLIGICLGLSLALDEKKIHFIFAFAGGIMIGISFFEIIPESLSLNHKAMTIISFVIGLLFMDMINSTVSSCLPTKALSSSLYSTGVLLIVGIGIHNFSEGLVLALTSYEAKSMNLVVGLGIAIHNGAEALATTAPLNHAQKHKIKTAILVMLSFAPLILGYLIGYRYYAGFSTVILSGFLGLTAGVMLYLSFKSLNKNLYGLFLGLILILIMK